MTSTCGSEDDTSARVHECTSARGERKRHGLTPSIRFFFLSFCLLWILFTVVVGSMTKVRHPFPNHAFSIVSFFQTECTKHIITSMDVYEMPSDGSIGTARPVYGDDASHQSFSSFDQPTTPIQTTAATI